MLTRCLRKDGISLPHVGQGLGKYAKEDIQIDVIREGINLGINFIDTAEIYGDGESEIIIGKAIKGIRDKVIIGTKFSPQNSSKNKMIESIENSLKRLGTDYIDLYQMHWLNPSIPIEETVNTLECIIRSGKTRYIGLCNVVVNEIQQIQSLLTFSHISTVQVEYNLFDRSIENHGLIKYCNDNNIIIIGYTPIDHGRVIDGDENKNIISDMAKKYKSTPVQIAMRVLTSVDPVVVIPHTTKCKHIRDNSELSNIDMDSEDIELILDISKKEIQYINPSDIRVIMDGEDNRKTYGTIEEAIDNKLNFVPSPLELSKYIKKSNNIKPVRLVLNKKNDDIKFNLVEGRIRYWAWVMAMGNKKIPSLIRSELLYIKML
jgi:diketogulonate reductase-like aldo/keto reductase